MKVVVDKGCFIPERAHAEDAGLDLKSPETVWIHPGEHVIIDLGVHMAIPTGYVGLITSKSGLMGKGLTVRGTVDAGYTGSIKAVLYNHGSEGYKVERGNKVCQIVILPIITPELELVDKLDETDRNTGGFGSTGA